MFFYFLLNQDNLFMIHHDWNLFCGICNTLTEHNRGQAHYLSYFDILLWYLFLTESNTFLIFFYNFYLSLFKFITRSSSLSSLEDIKLIVTVHWILQVPDCLRSFTRSLNYSLILLRNSSTDSILFSSLLLLYSI